MPETQTLQTIEGLQATPPSPLSFAPDVHVRAFVLPDPDGDVLVYDAPGAVEAAGPVRLRLFGHGHEAMFGNPVDAPSYAGAGDRDSFDELAGVIDKPRRFGDRIAAIPMPGHTPGSVAYVYDDGRRRYLFTADSVYLRHGEWRGAMLDSSDRASYVESLRTLAREDFDVLVPWAADAGAPPVATGSPAENRRRLLAIADRLEAGADH